MYLGEFLHISGRSYCSELMRRIIIIIIYYVLLFFVLSVIFMFVSLENHLGTILV